MTTPFSTLRALWASVPLLLRTQPDVVLVNGPGICVPVVAVAVALRVLVPRFAWGALRLVFKWVWRDDLLRRRGRMRTVFVESVCRVEALSVGAVCVFPLVDRLVVQWPQLWARTPLTDLTEFVV